MISIVVAVMGAGYAVSASTGIILVTLPIWAANTIWVASLLVTLITVPFLAFLRVRSERDSAFGLLKSRPTLWVRGKGVSLLTKPGSSQIQKDFGWHFDVNIANASPTMPLGIRSIVLEVQRRDYKATIRPYVGTASSDFQGPPAGDVPGTLTLQPSEPISGTLLFIESVDALYEANDDAFHSATILIIDGQGNEYKFPTADVYAMTNR